jgi:hypothetical protein
VLWVLCKLFKSIDTAFKKLGLDHLSGKVQRELLGKIDDQLIFQLLLVLIPFLLFEMHAR